ncbi:hypothetical protein Pdsh_02515 [Pyrodictium delaneyi]|uniref:ArnR1-like winged helix-turn-helix domain-containing protein n=1 Tax=Pyrodictium delaneyi TaxID=1273541 RepID=A0A211YRJ2_9CREN|nr:hypothetical protein Pdsh_02515 [Pyrodictium delaneyi]
MIVYGRDGVPQRIIGWDTMGIDSRPNIKRRDSLLIISDVLAILEHRGPLRKTRLMNLANLNPRSFQNYVEEELVRLGLIEVRKHNGHRSYVITPRGIHVLVLLRFIERGLEREGIEAGCRHCKELRQQIATKLENDGFKILSLAYIHGQSGAKYFHDIIVTIDKRPIACIDIHSSLSPTTRVMEASYTVTSCIDTGLPHIVVTPYTSRKYYEAISENLPQQCRLLIENYTGVSDEGEQLATRISEIIQQLKSYG